MMLDEYTVSYLSFDNDFIDVCGNSYSSYGNPVIKEDPTGKFNKALYLDGNSYLYMDGTIPLGGRDLTIDCWMYNMETPGSFKSAFCVAVSYHNRISTFYIGNGNIMTSTAAGNDQYFTINPEQWYHIAYSYVYEEDKWYTYLDGKLVATVRAHKDRGNFESGIGYDKIHSIWKGYIKNFRVSDGIARWKGENFDPDEKEKVVQDLQRIFLKPFIFDTLFKRIKEEKSFVQDLKRKINKNIKIINNVHKIIVNSDILSNDTSRHVWSYKRKIYAFVTSDRHKLSKNNKTQRDLIKNISG